MLPYGIYPSNCISIPHEMALKGYVAFERVKFSLNFHCKHPHSASRRRALIRANYLRINEATTVNSNKSYVF